MRMDDGYITLAAAISTHVLSVMPAEVRDIVIDEELCDKLPAVLVDSVSMLSTFHRLTLLCSCMHANTLDRLIALVLNLLSRANYEGDPLAILLAVRRDINSDAPDTSIRSRLSVARSGKLPGCHYKITLGQLNASVEPSALEKLRGDATYKEMAQKCRIRPETLSRWLNSVTPLRKSMYEEIARRVQTVMKVPVPPELVAEGLRSNWSAEELHSRYTMAAQAASALPEVTTQDLEVASSHKWSVQQVVAALGGSDK